MKIWERMKHNRIVQTTVSFGVASLILNLLSIWILGSAHIYDIVHAIPTILFYSPVVDLLGGQVPTELIFVPLAVVLDILIGILYGWGLHRWVKKDTYGQLGIWVGFAIYWIIITFQWLPIL